MASEVRRNLTDQLVTPDMARYWLKHWNTRNRAIKKSAVEKYAYDMRENLWTPGSRIAFYKDGNLCDGQHRLISVTQADVPVFFDVLIGASELEGANVDMGCKRLNTDALRISGAKEWISCKETVALVAWLAKNSRQCISSIGYQRVNDYAMQNEQWLRPVVEMARSVKKRRGLTSAAYYAQLVLALMSGVELAEISEFQERYIRGENYERNRNAVIRLREYCLAHQAPWGPHSVNDTCKKTQRAIKAFVDRQEITKLYAPEDWIYQVPDFQA